MTTGNDTPAGADDEFVVRAIAVVDTSLLDVVTAPKQGSEGAPDAWIDVDPRFVEGLRDIAVGDHAIVLSWLHRADRRVLTVHPRDDDRNPARGVFSTRSASRPNPIGLHEVTVHACEGDRLRVGPLELVDGTPILDIKRVI
jgi:tRNA-Thr(GGU) m(6)t(6)A37 methyltransferase TsaA